ncbi:fatty acid desaturase family protein [Mangrovitalea sediminis]|uniref:fatty acid desaturase family protein n=1 Tax=Mangrovitalea sediminis TaxID=1982043 RepID=UPI000BE5C910|nr:fatty acid desaturase [Mangrovitalea sediminis]
MTIAVSQQRKLFREEQGILPNSLALAWTTFGWLAAFVLMGQQSSLLNIVGVLLCAHTMILAAYLIHEAAHYTLFARPNANRFVGEWMSFIAGSSYAAFERIRHLHIRHHRDRADIACFDFKAVLARWPVVRRVLEVLEWAYIPATEILMHLQVVWRPLFVASQRRYLRRALGMLLVRSLLLVALAAWSIKAFLLYFLAYGLLLHVLNFFDAFHHTFEQFFVAENEPVPLDNRGRAYEQANTFSNLVSRRWPVLNLLTLNFGYHNAHHERASVPWYRLPATHLELYGSQAVAVMPLSELLGTWHRNRVRRVHADDYGSPGEGVRGADDFIGAHGVSFLTVI